MVLLWVIFVVSTAVIVAGGTRISSIADDIAHRTGLGSVWVGALFLPLVTSLPELAIGVSAILIDAPVMALGNLLGSNLLNLSFIFLLDLFQGRGPLALKLSSSNILTASLSISMLAVAALGIMEEDFLFSLGHVGGGTLIIFMIYLASQRLLYRFHSRVEPVSSPSEKEISSEQSSPQTPPSEDLSANDDDSSDSQQDDHDDDQKTSLKEPLLKFAVIGIVLIATSRILTEVTNRIAEQTGMTESMAGVVLLAISTSLPELVIGISAVRNDSFDLAVGGVLGANLLNLALLFIIDVLYFPGPLLGFGGMDTFIAAVSALLMTTIATVAISYRSQKSFLYVGWDAIIIIVLYILTVSKISVGF